MKAHEYPTVTPCQKQNHAGRLRMAAVAAFPMRGVFSKPSLRPWPGRKLPNELRPENVGRLSEALAGGVRDAEFERLVHRIDSGPIHRGM
jgi:hypothetical protein